MFTIIIVDAYGKTVETIQSMINPIGSETITTDNACYEVVSFAVDYKRNEIVVHVHNDF